MNKVNLMNQEQGIEAVNREMAILKEVSCPQIARIQEFYDEPSDFYIVMEYVKKGTLEEVLYELDGLTPETI